MVTNLNVPFHVISVVADNQATDMVAHQFTKAKPINAMSKKRSNLYRQPPAGPLTQEQVAAQQSGIFKCWATTSMFDAHRCQAPLRRKRPPLRSPGLQKLCHCCSHPASPSTQATTILNWWPAGQTRHPDRHKAHLQHDGKPGSGYDSYPVH